MKCLIVSWSSATGCYYSTAFLCSCQSKMAAAQSCHGRNCCYGTFYWVSPLGLLYSLVVVQAGCDGISPAPPLVNSWPSGKFVHLLYMYSILGRGSFCFNYCLNSAWHGGDQFVALLRWYGSPGFFDSGLQLICIFWSLVSHFPLDNAP